MEPSIFALGEQELIKSIYQYEKTISEIYR